MADGFKGACLCGQLSYESTKNAILAAHCQCVDCRKSSGTGHGTHVVITEDAFTITGKETSYDHPADSGNIVSRVFCPICGCPAYSKNSAMSGMIFVRASSLDDPSVIEPGMVVYTASAAPWDYIDPELPAFAGMPEGGPKQAIEENS